MIEVNPRLFVGDEQDDVVTGAKGWFVIHACREPYHRGLLGYSGRGAPKDHPEYLFAHRPGRLALNLMDVDDPAYVQPAVIDAALEAIADHIEAGNVLVHCNQGWSRSATIALLYLARIGRWQGLDFDAACDAFRALYPPFSPRAGMAEFARANWRNYAT